MAMNTECEESFDGFKQSYNDLVHWMKSVERWKDDGYPTNVPRLLMVRVVDIADSMVIQFEQCSEGCIPGCCRELIETAISLRYLHEDSNANVNSYLVNGLQQHISLLNTLKNNSSRSQNDIDVIEQAIVKFKDQITELGNVKAWPKNSTLCQHFYDQFELPAFYKELSGYSHSKLVQNVSHVIQGKNGKSMAALESLPKMIGDKIWETAEYLINDTKIYSEVLVEA